MAKGKNLVYTIQLTDKGTYRIKELNKEVKDLGKAFVSINGDIEQHNVAVKGTMAYYEQQIRQLKSLRDQTAKTGKQYQKFNTQIVGVEKKMKKLTSSTMSQEQVNAQMIANTGLASNTIVEFGRTISDAPFGIIGVTNNLSNLANNFELLSGKVGGTQNMFKLLMRQLKKGGAFVLAIQAVLALMTFFRDDIEKLWRSITGAAKKIKDGMVEIKDEAIASRAALKEYINVMNDVTASMQDQETALQALLRGNSQLEEALNKNMISGEARNKLTEEYFQLQLDFSEKSTDLNNKMEKFSEGKRKRVIELKEELSLEKQKMTTLQEELKLLEAEDGYTGGVEYRIDLADKEIKRIEKKISRKGIDINLLKETLDLEQKMNGFIDDRITKFEDIEEFSGPSFDFGSDDEDALLADVLAPREKTLTELINEVPVMADGAIDEVLSQWDEFMKDFRDKNEEASILRAETEALAKLEILYNQIEEETGTRIGFEEDKTRIEEHFANKRISIADKESQAKAKSLRVSAQAAVQVGKLMGQLAEDNKGLAIAGVIVEKAGAIAKIVANKSIADSAALLAPPGLREALLATNKITMITGIAATTASAVQAIKEIRNPESATASTTAAAEGATPQIQTPAINVVGATQESQLAQAISGQEEKPVKAFVVADDVTTTQELLRKAAAGATLG